MIITTAGRTDEEMIQTALQIANELGARYVSRNKRAIQGIVEAEQSDCIVVGKNRLELYHSNSDQPFFFHPNSSMFRIKRLLNGEKDPFIQATRLGLGMSLLDCTLGLASDSIVASFCVGATGKVVGVEVNPSLAFLVQKGLKSWKSGIEVMDEAMKRITVKKKHSLEVMRTLRDNSYDCVYFDPMFEMSILESDGIKGLAQIASKEGLSEEMMKQAVRIASKRVVLKDHYRSPRFQQFGFKVQVRKTAKFHFGVLEKQ